MREHILNSTIRTQLTNIRSADRVLQNDAFFYIIGVHRDFLEGFSP